MARRISSMNQLQKALQPIMVKMLDELAERVYETLNYFLKDYYTGWTPNNYQRTEAFLRSAIKVDAYPYKGGVKANTGLHGGLSVNHKPHVWDDTMDNTINNGSLLQLAVQYLRSQGISVRN